MLSVYRYSSRILIQCHLTPTLKPEQHAPNRETIAKLALPLLLRLLEEHTETAVDAVAEVAPGTGVSTQRDKTDENQATAAVERECDGEQEPAAAGEGGLVDGGEGEAVDRIDVLVKLIRLLAHLSISPKIGEAIASAPEVASLLHVLQATHYHDTAHVYLPLH